MSEYAEAFIAHLRQLREKNRGALATLKRSLAFPPGDYPAAYPHVERFAGLEEFASRRRALYLSAALYALHPQEGNRSLAAALAELIHRRESESIEKRFLALLGADPENLDTYLRQVVSLLAAEELGFNHSRLLDDLSTWLNPHAGERSDRVRRQWARDFYAPRKQESVEN